MAVERHADLRTFFKGNEEHRYFYVGESNGPKRQAEKVDASCEGRVRSCDHSVVHTRSGRDRDNVVEEGRKGPGLKKWVIYKH